MAKIKHIALTTSDPRGVGEVLPRGPGPGDNPSG